jgi:hypothetical protein
MTAAIRRLAGLPILAAALGCEAEPEQFHFINDTGGGIEVLLHDPPLGPLSHGAAAPGRTYLYTHRPVALHGEKLFAKIDDEEQFLSIMADGVTLVDAEGRRVRLDARRLRAHMTYTWPHAFTMHIRPDLFESGR